MTLLLYLFFIHLLVYFLFQTGVGLVGSGQIEVCSHGIGTEVRRVRMRINISSSV